MVITDWIDCGWILFEDWCCRHFCFIQQQKKPVGKGIIAAGRQDVRQKTQQQQRQPARTRPIRWHREETTKLTRTKERTKNSTSFIHRQIEMLLQRPHWWMALSLFTRPPTDMTHGDLRRLIIPVARLLQCPPSLCVYTKTGDPRLFSVSSFFFSPF